MQCKVQRPILIRFQNLNFDFLNILLKSQLTYTLIFYIGYLRLHSLNGVPVQPIPDSRHPAPGVK
jgi:hypothetical protein